MIGTFDLRVLELLTARLCHELVGPVAAVNNGVEFLAEDDGDLVRDAVTLVADSARRASARLQFYRFAYGFGGDAVMAGPSPFELAIAMFQGTPITCDYPAPLRSLPLDKQKLSCNLLIVGGEALPRGGRLILESDAAGPGVEVVGEAAGMSPEHGAALALELPAAALTSRTVQAYFTGLLAQAVGCRLVSTSAEPGRVRVKAVVD